MSPPKGLTSDFAATVPSKHLSSPRHVGPDLSTTEDVEKHFAMLAVIASTPPACDPCASMASSSEKSKFNKSHHARQKKSRKSTSKAKSSKSRRRKAGTVLEDDSSLFHQ